MKVLFGHSKDVAAWVKERIPHVHDFGACEALGVVDDAGALAAGVVFNHWLEREQVMSISAAAEKPAWCRPQILRIIFSYPFDQMRARRLTTITRADHAAKRTRRFLQHLGFKYEGIAREYYPDAVGAVIYGMLRRECRWLEG